MPNRQVPPTVPTIFEALSKDFDVLKTLKLRFYFSDDEFNHAGTTLHNLPFLLFQVLLRDLWCFQSEFQLRHQHGTTAEDMIDELDISTNRTPTQSSGTKEMSASDYYNLSRANTSQPSSRSSKPRGPVNVTTNGAVATSSNTTTRVNRSIGMDISSPPFAAITKSPPLGFRELEDFGNLFSKEELM